MRRLDIPERLSPLGIVTRPHNKYGYGDTQQPIKGRLCFDTAVQGSSGGFESLWIKSGRGQLPSRALNTVATELGLGGKLDEDEEGNKLDVKTWWYTHFDLFVDYCLRDTTLLRRCDEKLNAVAFHVAMQQYCGVRFQSVFNVTNYVRGLFGRYSELKSPSKFFSKREELTAANVLRVLPGRHENVALVDFMSLYPIIILCLNLCPTTKRNGPGEGIRQLSDGSCWDQTEKGVLPRIIEDMLALRADYKKEMKASLDEDEIFKFDMMQLAIKVCTNAIYGYVSQKNIGGMWTDPAVGAAITSTGRESINLLMAEAERQGHIVLAGHTDSCYIQAPFDEMDGIVEHLNDTIKTELDLPFMNVEFEAYFDYWTCIDAKNRNFGIITWPESKAGDLKVTGFEHKAANASPVTKEVQEMAFRLIGEGAEETEVNNVIRPISLSVRNGHKTAEELAPYGRLGKASYERVPPNAAKGALYYNANINPEDPIRVNDKAQWLYVNNVPSGMPTTNIVSFKDPTEIVEFSLDYSLMVEKFIRAKLQAVYSTLEWDLGVACGDAMPKKYF
jgi:DNA polymerase elongation subunit (family B)